MQRPAVEKGTCVCTTQCNVLPAGSVRTYGARPAHNQCMNPREKGIKPHEDDALVEGNLI